MVARSDNMLDLYQLAYALFLPGTQRELLGPEARTAGLRCGLPEVAHERFAQELRGRSPLSAVSVLEHRLFLGERLLRDTDAASMAASLETRLPLVDQVLLDAVDRVNDDTRFQPIRSKAMLRRIGLVGLDPALFNRPKSGFELPYDRWLRSALGSRIDSTLRDAELVSAAGLNPPVVEQLWRAFQAGAPGLYWTRIWALYVLIRWVSRYRVQI
jgi:asparagine synthase (glutamine-hydrolysing)